ncbi:hypothetical protein RhiirC2_802414 [Rhizophagus irregularis]|uniref:Uncharacterized protein n=1 Tax=Rhizophagus irregularis TaxID=588596 RepID=A0A2N1M1C4_9GLOM|nr:hypothetical protein RhiirC2_802414 [Rhizophagus irregularis]
MVTVGSPERKAKLLTLITQNQYEWMAIDSHSEQADNRIFVKLTQIVYSLSLRSGLIINDEVEVNKQTLLMKERKPPSKITKPKTRWINGCEKMLAWCGSSSSIKTHLLGMHKITKAIAMRYEKEELEKLKKPDNIINPHDSSKQESLTKNVINFVIGTVQP